MNHQPATRNQQLIYVTLDLRRGLFVAEATGTLILCSYNSDLLPELRKKGVKIWCFEELYPDLHLPDTSSKLIGHGKTLNFLRSLGDDLTFLVFKPSNKVRELIEGKGWKLQAPDATLCRKLEDKITFNELAMKYSVQVPRFEVLLWDEKKIPRFEKKFGNPFIVQGRIGHAGSSTWKVKDGKIIGPDERGGVKKGMRVKISKWVEGPTFTLNGYVSPEGKLVFGPLFQQLMHVPQWNTYEMGTVGISPIFNFQFSIFNSLKKLLLKLSPLFKDEGYSGFFGLDLIWKESGETSGLERSRPAEQDAERKTPRPKLRGFCEVIGRGERSPHWGKQWYLIECNPRFTASVSLQCLIDLSNERYPLLKYHAKGGEPEEDRFDFLLSPSAEGARLSPKGERTKRTKQMKAVNFSLSFRRGLGRGFGHLILRNTKPRPWQTPKTLKSGIYQLEEGAWKLRARTSDATQLKDEELLLILASKAGSLVDPGSDYATIIFRNSALDEGGGLHDRFLDFYERVILQHLIREEDLWNNKYASTKPPPPAKEEGWGGGHGGPFLFYKPSQKKIQTQLLPNEVVKLLGEIGDWCLVERADGTRGWMEKDLPPTPSLAGGGERTTPAKKEDFILPGKNSMTAEKFFQRWNGKPYLRGGNSEEGIDCSALVQRYFWEVKGILLPKYSQDQKAFCKEEVTIENIQDDDLVFLHSKTTKIPHVGILRDGKVWHSSLEGGVKAEKLEKLEEKYTLETYRRA